MNTIGANVVTDAIISSITTTKSRIDAIIEKVVAEKGWMNAYKNISAGSVLPAFKIFELLLKFKGEEKKIQMKLLKKSKKLVQKLEKYNLTAQYNSLVKDIQVTNPLMAVKILKRFGGDVVAAKQYILTILSLGTSKLLDEQVVEKYPNFESIYEQLLKKAISVPARLVLDLLIKYGGSISKVEEALIGKKNSTVFSELFDEGRILIKSLKENILGGENISSFTASPLTSNVEVVKTEKEEVEVEDEVQVKKLIEGNKFLMLNGFTQAKVNIQVLKKFGGDAAMALKYLIVNSTKDVSEDVFKNTKSNINNLSGISLSDIYNTAYSTSNFGKSSVFPDYSTYQTVPLEKYLSSASNINPFAQSTFLPVNEAILAAQNPYLNALSLSTLFGNQSLKSDIAQKIATEIGDNSIFSTARSLTNILGDIKDIKSKELNKYEIENILKKIMELLVIVSKYVSAFTSASSITGVDSVIDSAILRDMKKASLNSVSDPSVELLMNKMMDTKMKM